MKTRRKRGLAPFRTMALMGVVLATSIPIALAETTVVTETTTITQPAETQQTRVIQRGYVSVAPGPVRLAGQDVFMVRAQAGGFSAEERSIIIERNMNNALLASRDRSPTAVEIITINGLPVIRLGGKHVVTIDSNLASLYGTSCENLAEVWANSMRNALADQARVNNYVAQLSGDYLYSPYSPPYRRAQWEAARANHAASEARTDLAIDMVSSASLRDRGFEFMMKRNPVEAEKQFRRALSMESGNARAHYGLGAALLKQGRVDEAIPELEMARWLDADDAQVHIALGEALESKGLDREATVRYREAYLLQSENPAPALYIADIRESKNQIAKSVTELDDAIVRNPRSEYLRLKRKDQIGWRLTKPY